LVCCLEHGTLEYPQVSQPEESLIFFILRLLDRLRAMGTAPAADWTQYGRSLRSFARSNSYVPSSETIRSAS